jgi:hypothetical protein
MLIELTREDGTKFNIDTDRINAYGSSDVGDIKRKCIYRISVLVLKNIMQNQNGANMTTIKSSI